MKSCRADPFLFGKIKQSKRKPHCTPPNPPPPIPPKGKKNPEPHRNHPSSKKETIKNPKQTSIFFTYHEV